MVTAHNVSPTPKQSAPGLAPPKMGRAALFGMGAAGANLAIFYFSLRRNQGKKDATGRNPSYEHRLAHAASTNGELKVDAMKASSVPRRHEPLSSPIHEHNHGHITLKQFFTGEDDTPERRRQVPSPQRPHKEDNGHVYTKKVTPK
jgi:hypothetical protein